MSETNKYLVNKRLLLILPIILAASLLLASQTVSQAHASPYNGTGVVCITDSRTATNCPTSPPTIGPLSVGSTFSVGVFVNNSAPMGGFDIFVSVDPTYLNPTGAALGNLIANPTSTIVCVNDISKTGACTVGEANGPGVVEVSTLDSTGANECGGIPPCSGLAFYINYTVVSAVASTSIFFPSSAACGLGTSVSGTSVCVAVDDNIGDVLPETVQGATVTQSVVTVDPTSTSVSCVSPDTVAAATTCTATVTDTATTGATNPTGTVTFSSSGTGTFSPGTTCTPLTSVGTNQATCTVSYTPTAVGTGTHNIGASYSGDTTHQTSVATAFALTVTKATPTITSTVTPSSVSIGGSATDLATVSSGANPTGTVTYTAYSDAACTTLVFTSSGIALGSPSAPFTPTTVGTYFFVASYSGDLNNTAVATACGASGEVLSVAMATPSVTTAVTPSTITLGGSATDLATVTGGFSPTGTVTYTAYSDSACTTLVFTSSGIALGSPSSAFTPSAAGTYYFVAAYSGDANNKAVTTSCGATSETLTVQAPAVTGLVCITVSSIATSCSTSPATIGPEIVGSTFTVGVFIQGSQAMGGFDIYVSVNPTYLDPTSAALGSLIATPTSTIICINDISVTGACTISTANGPGIVEVSTIESTGSNECGGISPCSGMAFTITYHVVAFAASTPVSYPTDGLGCATSSVFSPANVCVLVADNVGTTLPETIQGATVTITQPTEHFTTTAVVCTPGPVTVGTSTSCTATVTDTSTSGATNPTGTVTFSTDGSGTFTPPMCTLSNSGTSAATCSVSYTPSAVGTGTTNIGASYGGDLTHQPSTSALVPITVTKATVALTTSVSSTSIPLGSSVTDQATLTGGYPSTGVSGSVTYYLFSNGACTGTGTPEGTATIGSGNSVVASNTVAPTAAGTYAFDAVYSGESNNNGVTSGCESFTVNDFTLTAGTASLTISAGSTGTDVLTATSLGGFTGSITLTNSSVPAGITVMFVPNSVTISTAGGTATSTLQVSVASTVGAQTFTIVVTGTSGTLSHQVSITVTVTTGAVPKLTHLNWAHDLSLQATTIQPEKWHAFVFNPQTHAVNVVIRIVGTSTTNPANTFDIVCGSTCVVTVGGSVNTTPGLTPISIHAGHTGRFMFQYILSNAFQGQTVKFTATLYWATGTSYSSSNSITGSFFVG